MGCTLPGWICPDYHINPLSADMSCNRATRPRRFRGSTYAFYHLQAMYRNPIGYGFFARQGRCVPPLAGRGGLPGGGRARRGPAVYRNGPYGPTGGRRGRAGARRRARFVLPGGRARYYPAAGGGVCYPAGATRRRGYPAGGGAGGATRRRATRRRRGGARWARAGLPIGGAGGGGGAKKSPPRRAGAARAARVGYRGRWSGTSSQTTAYPALGACAKRR